MDLPIEISACTPSSSLCWLTLGLILQESVDLRDSSVESDNGEAVVGGVQDQVLTHNGQTDKTEITTRGNVRRSTDINAGETRTNVSKESMSTRLFNRKNAGFWDV